MSVIALICALVTLTCQVMSQEPTIDMTSSSTFFLEGETLKLTCSLSVGIGNTGMMWRTAATSAYSIQKKQDEANGWRDLNHVSSKVNPFVNDGNINIVMGPTEKIVGSTYNTKTEISILKMRQSDAGWYRCLYKPSSDLALNSSTVEIVVKTNPYNLTFDVTSSEGNLTEIERGQTGLKIFDDVNPNDRVNLTCTSMGGEPDSTLVIRVGDSESSPKDVRVKHVWEGQKRGYMTRKRHVTVSTNEPDLSKTKGKMAVCEARMGNSPFLQGKIEFRLRLPPTVECAKPTVLAKLDKSANLTCVVKGLVDRDEIGWVMVQGKSKNTLKPDKWFSGRFHVTPTIKLTREPVSYSSTLEISNLKPDDFKSYTFYAKNEYGSTEKEIVLQRDNTGESTGASSQLAVGFVTFATLCIISLLFNKV